MRDLLSDLDRAYTGVLGCIANLEEFAPTGCRGWMVRDLVQHLAYDTERALVAMGRPTDEEPDRTRSTYWRGWQPPTGPDTGTRMTRIHASVWSTLDPLLDQYREQTEAVVGTAHRVPAGTRLRTQGHVLAIEDLLHSLIVELVIHHLDLVAGTPGAEGPAAHLLKYPAAVIGDLWGRDGLPGWDRTTLVLTATGRRALGDEERAALGADAAALPLFG